MTVRVESKTDPLGRGYPAILPLAEPNVKTPLLIQIQLHRRPRAFLWQSCVQFLESQPGAKVLDP